MWNTFLLAGEDTTAITLAFTFRNLAEHPEWQQVPPPLASLLPRSLCSSSPSAPHLPRSLCSLDLFAPDLPSISLLPRSRCSLDLFALLIFAVLAVSFLFLLSSFRFLSLLP
eukprot:jgi/Botrbrau1/22020/Bobra.0024s0034.1